MPEELKRREDRLAAIAAAKVKIEARAAERFAREQADYEAKLAARAAKAAATARSPAARRPRRPTPARVPSDQINLTDEESRIMVVAGGGFEQCYNAQAMVDTETMLVLVPQVTQAANDKQQVAPMLEKLQALPEGSNQPEQLLADAGYFSEANVDACESAGIEPLIAVKRDEHHPHWSERFREPAELPANPTPVQRMTHRLKTGAGRAAYALRKQRVARRGSGVCYERLRLATAKPWSFRGGCRERIEFRRTEGAPRDRRHLYLEDDGSFRADLGTWERELIPEELGNADVVGWLRNLDRKPWSLEIPYQSGGAERPMFPDLVVVRQAAGGYRFDILEPHDPSLADNFEKAVGLARFAERHGHLFDRIQLIRKLPSQAGGSVMPVLRSTAKWCGSRFYW